MMEVQGIVGISVCLGIILFMMIGAISVYLSERKVWNKGVCKDTGDKWVCKDMDSQGGRLYVSGDYSTWISYPVDRS